MTANTTAKRYKGRLDTLNRRADFLKQRIDSSDKDRGYDRQEYFAVVWAVRMIEEYPSEAMHILRTEPRSNEEEE